MASKLLKVAVGIAVLTLHGFVFSQATPSSPARERIIRADRPHHCELCDADELPAIEILYVAVGTEHVEINQIFRWDDSWLRDLKIGVRNISKRTITCVGVAFGVLAEINTKLKSSESWPWGFGFYRGDCGWNQKTFTRLNLSPGEQTVLAGTDVPRSYGDPFANMSSLAKAVFHEDAWIRFKGRKAVELPVAFSKTVEFLQDDSH